MKESSAMRGPVSSMPRGSAPRPRHLRALPGPGRPLAARMREPSCLKRPLQARTRPLRAHLRLVQGTYIKSMTRTQPSASQIDQFETLRTQLDSGFRKEHGNIVLIIENGRLMQEMLESGLW